MRRTSTFLIERLWTPSSPTASREARGARQSTYEDVAGGQYVIDDEGGRAYGVYLIPEKECLRTGASATDAVIGERLFTDGVVRKVFAGDQGQYVIGPDGERVYGVWVLVDEDGADKPVIVGK